MLIYFFILLLIIYLIIRGVRKDQEQEKERLEQERLEQERLKQIKQIKQRQRFSKRLKQNRLKKKQLKQKWRESEQLKKERLILLSELKCILKFKQEQERLEHQRLEQERLEQERLIRGKKIVNSISVLINEVKKINNQYQPDTSIGELHAFDVYCKNKKEFDTFNVDSYMIDYFRENLEFYNAFETIVNIETEKWNNYIKEYEKASSLLVSEDTYIYDKIYDIPFELYLNTESMFYINSKKEKLKKPHFQVQTHYVTPSCRFSYDNTYDIDYSKFLELINLANQPKAEKVKQSSLRTIEKEREKLKELERAIHEQAEELRKQQEEFLKATKGHIYSNNLNNDVDTKISKDINIAQQLKILKNKLNNGEITIEEYQKLRKDLM